MTSQPATQRPTARQIVRDDAAKYGWKLLSFADRDSYVLNGYTINLSWVSEGRGCIGAHVKESNGEWHSDYSPVCIVHARGWLKLYGLEATVDHAVGK